MVVAVCRMGGVVAAALAWRKRSARAEADGSKSRSRRSGAAPALSSGSAAAAEGCVGMMAGMGRVDRVQCALGVVAHGGLGVTGRSASVTSLALGSVLNSAVAASGRSVRLCALCVCVSGEAGTGLHTYTGEYLFLLSVRLICFGRLLPCVGGNIY